MKLAQLQESFQAHMLRGDEAIAEQISADGGSAVAQRLSVYTEAYAARLAEVLGETFPAVQAVLGERHFARCVSGFAHSHPSRFRSARAYGDDLHAWLAQQLSGPRAAGIADLARFEWAVAGAFDAADAPALPPESLAGVEPERWPGLQWVFSPTLRRVSVASNCVAWWKFACAGADRPRRWRATGTQQWLVWREGLAVFYRRLARAETQALDAALAGHSFGELCEQLADPAAAAALLHGWYAAGLISGVRTASAES